MSACVSANEKRGGRFRPAALTDALENRSGSAHLEYRPLPRARRQIHFALTADPATIGDLHKVLRAPLGADHRRQGATPSARGTPEPRGWLVDRFSCFATERAVRACFDLEIARREREVQRECGHAPHGDVWSPLEDNAWAPRPPPHGTPAREGKLGPRNII
jgi:hypothetical protein